MYSVRKTIGLVSVAMIIIAFTSCGGSGGGSETTGWNYNDAENGGFEVSDFVEQEAGPGLVLIEGGTFVMGATQDQVVFNANNYPRRLTIRSFYMDQVEVSNVDYLEYLYWLRRVYEENHWIVRQRALPDTNVWRSKLGYNEPLVNNYLRHPAYKNYPVVGVDWLQANDYAKWRTDRVNELILIEQGVLAVALDQQDENNFNTEAHLLGQYDYQNAQLLVNLGIAGGDRRVRMEDGIIYPEYRLPTEAEWEYAALGLIENTLYERISQRKTYPWNGNYTRTSDKKYYGGFVANFKRGRGDYMGVAGALNDGADIPTIVGSYVPNDYGLYNMGGNVSEWVLDVYRPQNLDDIDDLNGFRGNVFEKQTTGNNGKIVTKDSLGRIKYEPISIDDAAGRTNYAKADNINYLDGDLNSTLDEWNKSGSATSTSPITSTSSTGIMYEYRNSSMISDEVRVYKGGSWKDPAYYLSPSSRRFLEQTQSTNFIGFRCAMNRVGSPMSGRK